MIRVMTRVPLSPVSKPRASEDDPRAVAHRLISAG